MGASATVADVKAIVEAREGALHTSTRYDVPDPLRELPTTSCCCACTTPAAYVRAGISVEEQRLVFAGRQLADDCSLAHCGVEEEATLNVLGRLLGGAKKRKKKTYTKPKKIKHKHKKIKLRVLQFYKVCAVVICAGLPSTYCQSTGMLSALDALSCASFLKQPTGVRFSQAAASVLVV